MYGTIISGNKYSDNFKVYITKDDKIISGWHDIPYKTSEDNVITVFNEIPRFENAKFELSTKTYMNPIIQDTKKGNPRFVSNVFPFKGYIWNYGAVPQTWESPKETDPHTKAKGDNDPIDVIEIGEKQRNIGEVYTARVLGALAMLDDGECDWKILIIGTDNPNYDKIKTLKDVRETMPGFLEGTVDWFANYKQPDGKTVKFALNSEFQPPEFALNILNEAHKQWKTLFETEHAEFSLKNTSIKNSKHFINDVKVDILKGEKCSEPPLTNSFFFKKSIN